MRLFWDYSTFSEQKYLNELSIINWPHAVSDESNPDKLFTTFYNKLNKIVNKHAPLKPTSKRKAKIPAKPWITKGIRKAIKQKNKFLWSGNNEKYKFYRNKIVTLTRRSKRMHYYNYFEVNICKNEEDLGRNK